MARRTLSRRDDEGTRRVLTGGKSFKIAADTSGLESYLDALAEDAEEAIRPAAQAGAQVLYEQIKANVAGLGRVTGNLAGSIYQYYSDENSQAGVRASYNASWNHIKAPHGHLVEFGYLQRYRYRPDGMGPMVRPGMDGQKKPGRRASQAEKNAYYVTLDAPKHVPGKFFVQRAGDSAMDRAYKAAEEVLFDRILSKAGGV